MLARAQPTKNDGSHRRTNPEVLPTARSSLSPDGEAGQGHCCRTADRIPDAAAEQFPAEYRGDAFVALKGSWNRSEPTGYKVVRVRFKDGRPDGSYENFVTAFGSRGSIGPRYGDAPLPWQL
jgi:hypothetical protein